MHWNLTPSQVMYLFHSMNLGWLIKELLGYRIKRLLTIGLLVYQISTNWNQIKGTNLKDFMWDVMELWVGCKIIIAQMQNMGKKHITKITWEASFSKSKLLQKMHSITSCSPSFFFSMTKLSRFLVVFFFFKSLFFFLSFNYFFQYQTTLNFPF